MAAGKTRANSTGAGKASTGSCNTSTGVVASEARAGVVSGDTSASSSAAQGTANRAWLTLEAIIALFAAGEDTTLLLEVGHADSWKSGGGVVLGSVVVNLVDGDGGVDDSRLDDLLLDDGLDGLVDVVVDVLAGNDGSGGAGLGDLALNALVRELSSLTLKTSSYLLRVAVLEMPVLDAGKLVLVLFREDLAVEDGLHRGVVVVLVNLLVDGGLDLLMEVLVEGLVGDGGSDLFVDGGVMVAGLGHELADCCLSLVHCC